MSTKETFSVRCMSLSLLCLTVRTFFSGLFFVRTLSYTVLCNRDLVFYPVDPYVSNQVHVLNKETVLV